MLVAYLPTSVYSYLCLSSQTLNSREYRKAVRVVGGANASNARGKPLSQGLAMFGCDVALIFFEKRGDLDQLSRHEEYTGCLSDNGVLVT